MCGLYVFRFKYALIKKLIRNKIFKYIYKKTRAPGEEGGTGMKGGVRLRGDGSRVEEPHSIC